MAQKFGPTRGEWIFRAVVSAFGLGFLTLALVLRGLPEGPGLVEIVGVGGLFFGGSLVLAIWKLVRKDYP